MLKKLMLLLLTVCLGAFAQGPGKPAARARPAAPAPSADLLQYVKVGAPVYVITHVRLIDGTGAAPKEDQAIMVDHGRIAAIWPSAQVKTPEGTPEIDLHDHTVMPGLVGMHNHLYYTASINRGEDGKIPPPGFFLNEIPYTAPRLYLAAGVTTMRTTGSLEPFTDIGVKRLIDTAQMPGPRIDLTAPYLEGQESPLLFAQMNQLANADEARRFVNFWAGSGFTSWKAYMYITRDELGAAIEEVHKRKMKLSGHLCSVTWPEAIAMGIDDFEHGPVYTDTEFVADKKPDVCPSGRAGMGSWMNLDINGPQVQKLIKDLVDHKVAVTSTLPVFAAGIIDHPPDARVLNAMSPESRASFLTARAQTTPESNARMKVLLKKEMEFERAFAKAGGLLLAGPDPTGNGGVLPGFGDWQELELLVEAGFTPLEAIHIATANGAEYLGLMEHIGTLAPGKQADMVVIRGNPAAQIKDVEKTVLVFKDGVGFDSQKLIESARGQVGTR